MTHQPAVGADVDRAFRRRLVSVPGAIAAAAIATLSLPVTWSGAAVADVVTRAQSGRHRRIVVFAHQALVTEAAGLLICGWLWVRAGFGVRVGSPASMRRHRRLQLWWARRLAELARRHFAVQIEPSVDAVRATSCIVVARHACLADALIPTILLGDPDRDLRHVLTRGLRWGPCLDIVGGRLPNLFVDRQRNDAEQRESVQALAANLDDDGLVIFPEGRFPTPDAVRRARAHLERDDPVRAALLAPLVHLLPPRPGGFLAALQGAPDADVVIINHHGLEDAATLAQVYRRVPFSDPVTVAIQRFDRSAIPAEKVDQVRWLDEQWLAMDAWVAEQALDRSR